MLEAGVGGEEGGQLHEAQEVVPRQPRQPQPCLQVLEQKGRQSLLVFNQQHMPHLAAGKPATFVLLRTAFDMNVALKSLHRPGPTSSLGNMLLERDLLHLTREFVLKAILALGKVCHHMHTGVMGCRVPFESAPCERCSSAHRRRQPETGRQCPPWSPAALATTAVLHGRPHRPSASHRFSFSPHRASLLVPGP